LVLTDLTIEGFTHRSYDQVSAFHDHVSLFKVNYFYLGSRSPSFA
jgi:hypothetical protein